MLQTRVATKQDAELIADMSRATFYDTFAPDNTVENMDKFMQQQFSKESLMKEVGAPGSIFLLTYDGDKPAGYARLRESDAPEGLPGSCSIEIARIYALSSVIGKGVGSELMQQCIHIAKEKGCDAIWLGVWEHNQRAINFYRKWGFEKFSEHPFILGDDKQTDWLMAKSL